MSHDKPLLSFLIPALNEASNIGETLKSIRQSVPPSLSWEVIVGDHGSVDDTRAIARRYDARVIEVCGGTIAALRNHLAAVSNGRILIFNDADVLLTKDWSAQIPKVISEIEHRPDTIIGAQLSPPPDHDNWLIKNWFFLQNEGVKAYVGTGHMIIGKAAFIRLSGFEESLSSGEDYDLCQRAKNQGYEIRNDKSLHAIHLDYPVNLRAFFQREVWHGAGDFASFHTFINSRVAVAASLFFGLIILTLLSINISRAAAAFFALIALCMPIFLSFWKFPKIRLKQRIVNMFIWVIYLIARAFSVIKRRETKRYYEKKSASNN